MNAHFAQRYSRENKPRIARRSFEVRPSGNPASLYFNKMITIISFILINSYLKY